MGDHPENDIRSAQQCGLMTVFLQRGPWALTHLDSEAARLADLRVNSLGELPERLATRDR